MKPDNDPGRASEFEVLAIVILLAFAGASLADFLRAPIWTPPDEVSTPVDEGGYAAIEPWIPHVPEGESRPSQR